jgi:hypothetical protein
MKTQKIIRVYYADSVWYYDTIASKIKMNLHLFEMIALSSTINDPQTIKHSVEKVIEDTEVDLLLLPGQFVEGNRRFLEDLMKRNPDKKLMVVSRSKRRLRRLQKTSWIHAGCLRDEEGIVQKLYSLYHKRPYWSRLISLIQKIIKWRSMIFIFSMMKESSLAIEVCLSMVMMADEYIRG